MTNAPTTRTVNQGAQVEPQPNISTTANDLRDTATAAQRERLLKFLIDKGSANTMFARDRLNILCPAARIMELREQGHKIHTDRITINDRDGRLHYRVARYVLLKLAEVSA